MQTLPAVHCGRAGVRELRATIFSRRSRCRPTPEGADVYIKAYDEPKSRVGAPRAHADRHRAARWDISAGESSSRATTLRGRGRGRAWAMSVSRSPQRYRPRKAVTCRVVRCQVAAWHSSVDFCIDRFEVTNKAFKHSSMLAAIGAARTGSTRSSKTDAHSRWDEAMAEFRDATGRPGRRRGNWAPIPRGQDRLAGERHQLVRGRRLREVRQVDRFQPSIIGGWPPASRSTRRSSTGATSPAKPQRGSANSQASVRSAPTTWPAT